MSCASAIEAPLVENGRYAREETACYTKAETVSYTTDTIGEARRNVYGLSGQIEERLLDN
jgi:hypothetical protein